jgi:16S rRNA (cytidine1402-2'-O)-methyltransferase
LLGPYAQLSATLVFFERKNRVLPTLELAFEVLGEREFCLARELTKKHEQFINGRLGQLQDFTEELLGEVTVVIGPPEGASVTPRSEVLEVIRGLMETGVRPRDAARAVRDRTSGWSAKEIYELIVELSAE